MGVGLDMRRTLVTLMLVLMVTVTGAWADEDSHRQAATELLELAHMDEVLTKSIDQMLAFQVQQNPGLAPYEKIMQDFFNKYMGWDALKEDFVKIYMEEFTEAELRDMIVFYKTPTGQKAVLKTPVLAARGAALGQERVQENIGELLEMIEAETKRLMEAQEKMEQEENQPEEHQSEESQPEEQQMQQESQ